MIDSLSDSVSANHIGYIMSSARIAVEPRSSARFRGSGARENVLIWAFQLGSGRYSLWYILWVRNQMRFALLKQSWRERRW